MALRTLLGRVAGPGITNPTASRRLSGGASLVSPPPLPLLPTVHQGLSFRARFRCASAPSHHSPHDDSRGSSRGSGSPMEPSPTSAASHSPAADSEHVGVNDPSATGGDVEQQHHEGTAHHVLHHHTAEEKNKAAFERFGKPFDELDTNQKKAVGGMLGGQTRREQLGHEGYVEMGHTGGEARKEQLGHEGYVEMGHKGGEARKEQLSHEGYVDMGHKSGEARRERHRQEDSSE